VPYIILEREGEKKRGGSQAGILYLSTSIRPSAMHAHEAQELAQGGTRIQGRRAPAALSSDGAEDSSSAHPALQPPFLASLQPTVKVAADAVRGENLRAMSFCGTASCLATWIK
jgi:hypothetical protein